MKKNPLVAVSAILAGSVMMTSCIGSHALFNKVNDWNQSVSNKWVNEILYLAMWIVPVYEISMLADVLVINTIGLDGVLYFLGFKDSYLEDKGRL